MAAALLLAFLISVVFTAPSLWFYFQLCSPKIGRPAGILESRPDFANRWPGH
jgi:hypothetical protein